MDGVDVGVCVGVAVGVTVGRTSTPPQKPPLKVQPGALSLPASDWPIVAANWKLPALIGAAPPPSTLFQRKSKPPPLCA